MINSKPIVFSFDSIEEIAQKLGLAGIPPLEGYFQGRKVLMRGIWLPNITPEGQDILLAACRREGIGCFCDGEKRALIVGSLASLENFLHLLSQTDSSGLGKTLKEALDNYEKAELVWECRGKSFVLGANTLIMGILNVTPDSFSDGGRFSDPKAALERAHEMVDEGADIIDIGGESTRPGAEPLDVDEELKRVMPVLEKVVDELSDRVAVSVDTYKAEVARRALEAGAHIINDVRGLRDEKMRDVVGEFNAGVVIMHMQGTPQDMQENPVYESLISQIIDFLGERVEEATKAGVGLGNIVVDPGIGFGKRTEHNLEILKRIDEFRVLGRPILVGVSRKSVIGNVLGLPVSERLEGTAACVAWVVSRGVHIVRVHDVLQMKRVVRMIDAIREVGYSG